ncbi:MAG: twin-arginine translocase TatA/TatE family subunit [Candidatus Melainabacteria bacterium]|nr:twin-arginine translocase TatA/TatE family subunit [Candidatus Melainabacteria bacterium]
MLSSPVDIAIIAGVALLFFGPKKLPELGKALGQGIGNFKKGLQEAHDEVKNALKPEDQEKISPAIGMDETNKQKDATS